MKEALRTIASGSAAFGLTGLFIPIVSGAAFVDEYSADLPLNWWASTVLSATGVRTVAKGLEKLPHEHFVLVVNHQSHFDSLVLLKHVRRHIRFIAKRELGNIPFFGAAMRRAGNVFVDRSGSGRDRQTMHEAVQAVRERVDIVFFAEGTRSPDGVLKPFKKGAAMLALEAQVPLVPAAVAGTFEILPKQRWAIRPSPAALVIGDPIPTKGLTMDAGETLTEQAHAAVAALLAEGQALVAAHFESEVGGRSR